MCSRGIQKHLDLTLAVVAVIDLVMKDIINVPKEKRDA